MMDMESRRPSIVSATLALMTDRDLALAPDGSFRITLGGKADGPNHIDLKPGVVVLGMRDMLSDWHQRRRSSDLGMPVQHHCPSNRSGPCLPSAMAAA